MVIYKCIRTSGSGKEIDTGDWEMKETPKTILFNRVRRPLFVGWESESLKIKKDGKNRHGFCDWEDGTYTIYPNRAGIPYYFEPLG